MTTITALGLTLLILMVIIGGKQGWKAFMSLVLNFGLLFFAVILIAFHVPPMFVTVSVGIVILAITIFMGDDDLLTSQTAFYASLIVMAILLIIIVSVEHWAMVQGFGAEDSDALEGMSLYIGMDFLKISVTTTILSTLGAIAEASIAISAGLSEVLEQHPDLSNSSLMANGMSIGESILGTTFNTLFFGFFGGFLALFIWFMGLNYSFGEIMNNKIFVSELIMIFVSFIGVIITIPLTTLVMTRQRHKKFVDNE